MHSKQVRIDIFVATHFMILALFSLIGLYTYLFLYLPQVTYWLGKQILSCENCDERVAVLSRCIDIYLVCAHMHETSNERVSCVTYVRTYFNGCSVGISRPEQLLWHV